MPKFHVHGRRAATYDEKLTTEREADELVEILHDPPATECRVAPQLHLGTGRSAAADRGPCAAGAH
jgi:hypothetical protein